MDFSTIELPVADVLSAAMVVVAGFAGIWAIKLIVRMVKDDNIEYYEPTFKGPYGRQGFDDQTGYYHGEKDTRSWYGNSKKIF